MTPEEARRVLGVAPEAGVSEIRRAYLRWLKRWHPDRVEPLEEGPKAQIRREWADAFGPEVNSAEQATVGLMDARRTLERLAVSGSLGARIGRFRERVGGWLGGIGRRSSSGRDRESGFPLRRQGSDGRVAESAPGVLDEIAPPLLGISLLLFVALFPFPSTLLLFLKPVLRPWGVPLGLVLLALRELWIDREPTPGQFYEELRVEARGSVTTQQEVGWVRVSLEGAPPPGGGFATLYVTQVEDRWGRPLSETGKKPFLERLSIEVSETDQELDHEFAFRIPKLSRAVSPDQQVFLRLRLILQLAAWPEYRADWYQPVIRGESRVPSAETALVPTDSLERTSEPQILAELPTRTRGLTWGIVLVLLALAYAGSVIERPFTPMLRAIRECRQFRGQVGHAIGQFETRTRAQVGHLDGLFYHHLANLSLLRNRNPGWIHDLAFWRERFGPLWIRRRRAGKPILQCRDHFDPVTEYDLPFDPADRPGFQLLDERIFLFFHFLLIYLAVMQLPTPEKEEGREGAEANLALQLRASAICVPLGLAVFFAFFGIREWAATRGEAPIHEGREACQARREHIVSALEAAALRGWLPATVHGKREQIMLREGFPNKLLIEALKQDGTVWPFPVEMKRGPGECGLEHLRIRNQALEESSMLHCLRHGGIYRRSPDGSWGWSGGQRQFSETVPKAIFLGFSTLLFSVLSILMTFAPAKRHRLVFPDGAPPRPLPPEEPADIEFVSPEATVTPAPPDTPALPAGRTRRRKPQPEEPPDGVLFIDED